MPHKQLVMIGKGSHATVILELLAEKEFSLFAIAAQKTENCGDTLYINDDEIYNLLDQGHHFIMGMGGQTIETLKKRLDIFQHFFCNENSPALIHSTAIVSPSALIEKGAQLCAGSIVQTGVTIGNAALVNTGSIIEHGSIIGEGSHVAPGAIVLGNVKVGKCSMIGAGAILLPGSIVPNYTLIKANTVYK